ncbi:DUF5941 domain-containing protein [Streptomyces sp. V3I7]|uniref:DUF5941 domain-containing protein n=1 Tax=Streptomyces sp. V3I7 TaxID=3042278 RepID=UPI00277D8BD8|nr:DUF5941 domain-containing protein [Streptomyces sp. V3I7]MDQ0994144.1 phosphatidylglycerophosphate synthase [Streptomyces sp. V3I7]
MSTAILTGQPVPGSSLESDLRSLGFEVRVASGTSDAETLLATVPSDERVAVVDARFVGHVHALRLGLTDPRFPLAAVPGAVTAQPAGRQALTRAMARETSAAGDTLATAGPTAPPAASEQAGAGAVTAVDALADRIGAALDADGVDVHRPDLGSLVAAVPADPQARNEARQAVAGVDDEAVRLKTAVKARDGFFTTFCISPYSRYIARWCARRGLTPNQVTTASLLTALIAAACAATGTRTGFVAAGVLLLCSFVLDCTDGQLARYSLQYSTLGAWLDATFDRAKEYAYYAGLALGAARGGHDDVWALALGAMILQTCRHVVDFSFNEANHDATANTSPTAALSGKLDSVGWTVWVRRMIVLPIGERWAMIAVLTAFTTPRITFYVLLVGCAIAATYTTAGRVLRSLTRKAVGVPPGVEHGGSTDRAAQALADLADNGPLATGTARVTRAIGSPLLIALAGTAVLAVSLFSGVTWAPVAGAVVYTITSGLALRRPLKGALDWLVPPVLRAAEYGTVLVLAAKADVNGALPAAFGLVAAVAYHHYDTVYRIRGDAGAPPAWLVRAIGGQEGRTLLVTVLAALLTAPQFTLALTVLAVAVALLVLVESIRFWVSAHQGGAPAVHDEGETA